MQPRAQDLNLLVDRALERGFLDADLLTREPRWTIGGRYRVLELLGEGASGAVFRVHDQEVDRDAALKLLAPGLANGLERFRQEIRVLAQFRHEGIVPIYATGVHGEQPFYVMEAAPSGSLADSELDLRRWVRVLIQVCLACHAAHAHGVIHRDLKPENVLLVEGRAMLIDFGVAKLLDATSPTQTQSGTVVGTPSYMAPEQLSGKEPVGAWSDTHALGVMLFERLTGSLPFAGTGLMEVLVQLLDPARPDPRALAPDAPEELCRIAQRAIARDPDARYGSAEELALDLSRWLNGPQEAPRSRPPWGVLGAAAGALACALGGWALVQGGARAPLDEPVAALPDEATPEPRRPAPSADAPEPAPPRDAATTPVAPEPEAPPGQVADPEPEAPHAEAADPEPEAPPTAAADPAPEAPPAEASPPAWLDAPDLQAVLEAVPADSATAPPADLRALARRLRREVLDSLTTGERLLASQRPELEPPLVAARLAVQALPAGPERVALECALLVVEGRFVQATNAFMREAAERLQATQRGHPQNPDVATSAALWALVRVDAAAGLPMARLRARRVGEFSAEAEAALEAARSLKADPGELEALGAHHAERSR